MDYDAGNPDHIKKLEKENKALKEMQRQDLRNLMKTREGGAYINNLLINSMIFSNCMSKGNSMGVYNEGWRNLGLTIFKEVCEAMIDEIPWWMRDMLKEQLGVRYLGDEENG